MTAETSPHNNATCPRWQDAWRANEERPTGDRDEERFSITATADGLIYIPEQRLWVLDSADHDADIVVFHCPWCGARLEADGTVTPPVSFEWP